MDEYCAYLRKSRLDLEAERHGAGDTLLRHETILKDLAYKNGHEIKYFYREVVSGDSIEAREEIQKMLADIEDGIWKGVYVVEVERLARGDTSDQGLIARTFKYSSTLIYTPVKIYDPNNDFDEEYFEYGLFKSRQEYKTIKRRLQDGRKTSVKEGKFTSSIPPYGYEKYKLKGDKGFSLRPNPEEAKIIQMIYQLYTYGEEQSGGSFKRLGSTAICKKLNSMGIKPPMNNSWSAPAVLYILKNPVYIGKLWWNRRPEQKKIENGKIVISRPVNTEYELYNARHEAIIDESVWNETQYKLKNCQVPKIPNAFKTAYNPLAGIVMCGVCGHGMVRRPYNSGGDDTLMCPVSGCKNVSSKLLDVEETLLNTLQKWLDEYKINTVNTTVKGLDITSQIQVKESIKKSLSDDEAKTSKQINNLHDLLEQNVYDIETFRKRKMELTNRVEKIKDNIAQTDNEINKLVSTKKNIIEFIPKVENVLSVYNNIDDILLKNEMLKSILIKVDYFKSEKGTRFVKAPFTLNLYPRLPE